MDSNAHFGEVECNEISRFGDFVEISSLNGWSYWMYFEELLFWEFETIVREFCWDLDFGFSTWNVHFGKEKLECNEISRLLR